ncbi:hypothetical protein [Bacillus sp. JJ722]|uniref:hypothetical protein n=1 Tax=Bacillus sp. JJ722 TaxID=3122973 RepID=UPI002FFF951E
MNKFGILTFSTVIINLLVFFITSGPNTNSYIPVIVFFILSIAGIVFAFLSKSPLPLAAGFVLNSFVLAFTFFLLLGMRMGEV